MNCTLQPAGNHDYRCTTCGRLYADVRRLPLRVRCPGTDAQHPPAPSLVRRAWNYAAAVSRWIAAGRPTRTPEQIAERLATCQACPHFNAARRTCRKCGCCVSVIADALANKLAMGTEVCPDDPPRWR